jgi:hypothetical protein
VEVEQCSKRQGTICGGTLYAASLEAAFFRPAFFGAAGCDSDAFFIAHLLFWASAIFFRAALLTLRLGFAATGCAGSEDCLSLAYLARWAAAILRREAALNLRLGLSVSGDTTAGSGLSPANTVRSSAIRESIWVFWNSKPAIAAWMISGVSFCAIS